MFFINWKILKTMVFFKKILKYHIFHFIFLNLFAFINSYDSSLLKVNYFYEETNLCYINALSNSNGDLYFEFFGNRNANRYLYGLNATTGKEIIFNNNKILKINFGYISTYHDSIILNYDNNEKYIFTFNPDYCEFININTLSYTYRVSDNFIFFNQLKQASYRN